METVEVVIKLPKKSYDMIIESPLFVPVDADTDVVEAMKNATVLPKGHGRLLILDEKLVRKYFTSFSFSCQKWISEVGISNATWRIIEADKAESEDEK